MSDEELREKLADLAHSQWSGWTEYLFEKSIRHPRTGGVTIPHTLVKRWVRQMRTPYAELSESEKDSDRKEADKFLTVLKEYNSGK